MEHINQHKLSFDDQTKKESQRKYIDDGEKIKNGLLIHKEKISKNFAHFNCIQAYFKTELFLTVVKIDFLDDNEYITFRINRQIGFAGKKPNIIQSDIFVWNIRWNTISSTNYTTYVNLAYAFFKYEPRYIDAN
jgi:hypothetical protein